MKWKDFWDSPEEIFVGAMLQFPLYFIVGWYIIPIQLVCGLLWRWGGVTGGSKLARRVWVPLVVCASSLVILQQWTVMLAVPFMIWACPFSYGAKSWLFNFISIRINNERKANLLTRGILFIWYWTIYGIALSL